MREELVRIGRFMMDFLLESTYLIRWIIRFTLKKKECEWA